MSDSEINLTSNEVKVIKIDREIVTNFYGI